jgi:hypothetical protein
MRRKLEKILSKLPQNSSLTANFDPRKMPDNYRETIAADSETKSAAVFLTKTIKSFSVDRYK